MASQWRLPAELISWITALSQVLHRRSAWRLLPLLTGLLFAQGRRTVASWLRAGGLGDSFRRYHYFLGSLGRKTSSLAGVLLGRAADVIQPGDRVLLALDDTPTPRYGPMVEGAGIHHNPTWQISP
ncbi:MAG TPA: transposase [Gemmataceae bacterium]|nr:transposase [Gemmataceae bacterium]